MTKDRSGPPDDESEFRSASALREAIPTRAHAEMLFGQVVELLGDLAWVETCNGEQARTLYRREAPGSNWILPWPLLSVSRGGREGPAPILTAIPGVYEELEARRGPVPKIRGLGPGRLTLHDGPQFVTVCYGGDGRWFECTISSPPQEALAGVLPVLAAGNASPVELVASFAAGLDLKRHGPGRVHLPVALPGGAESVWRCGLWAFREMLVLGWVPAGVRWLAADGWTGKALECGATRDDALRKWRLELARVRPFPVKPKPPPEPLPEPSVEQQFDGEQFSMRVTLRGPTSDVPWVEPTLANSPVAVLSLDDVPPNPPPFAEWARTIDAYGTVRPVALLREREARGLTLIGDRVLAAVAAEDLDAQLAEADRAFDARPSPTYERPPGFPEPPPADTTVRTYSFFDYRTKKPSKAAVRSIARGQGFHAYGLDGEQLRWEVVRVRRDPD